jgi:RimJ/RimL family protein N-acetyltransferase
MLVFSTNSKKTLKEPEWDNSYSLKIEHKFLRKRFMLLDSDSQIAHESTLYFFTPLGLSIGHFGYVIGHCMTDNKYKGKGLYGKMISHLVSKYYKMSILLFVEDENIASIRGLEKAGLVVVKRFTIKRKYLNGLWYKVKQY